MAYKKSSGFSMVEIMIVIALIGLIASLVGPRIMQQFGKGKKKVTEGLIRNVKSAFVEYELDKGNKPSGDNALKKLIEADLIKGKTNDEGMPVDAWENELTVNAPPKLLKGEKGYKYYEIISFGETGDPDAPRSEWIVDGE